VWGLKHIVSNATCWWSYIFKTDLHSNCLLNSLNSFIWYSRFLKWFIVVVEIKKQITRKSTWLNIFPPLWNRKGHWHFCPICLIRGIYFLPVWFIGCIYTFAPNKSWGHLLLCALWNYRGHGEKWRSPPYEIIKEYFFLKKYLIFGFDQQFCFFSRSIITRKGVIRDLPKQAALLCEIWQFFK
jgi:hypothetical protein